MEFLDDKMKDYLNNKNKELFFRGHSNYSYSLTPSIGRIDFFDAEKANLINIEKSMLDAIRRRGILKMEGNENGISGLKDFPNLELLVHAQHYGMKTRLLDWTTNPLAALWFSCIENIDKDGAIYILDYDKSSDDKIKILSSESAPLENKKTYIFLAKLNNKRILAQNGCFTVHGIKDNKIIPLDEEEEFKSSLTKIKIPSKEKPKILANLNVLGINYESIYPDLNGLYQQINWDNNSKNEYPTKAKKYIWI